MTYTTTEERIWAGRQQDTMTLNNPQYNDEYSPEFTTPEVKSIAPALKNMRRLKLNELVSVGDFVMDDRQVLTAWDGPTGFRADSFLKPIYRRDRSRS